jgi:hypothetical protein
MKKNKTLLIIFILIQNIVLGQFSNDTLIKNQRIININNTQKINYFFKPENSTVNYFQTLSELLYDNNLGFYSYDLNCYYTCKNQNSTLNSLCDSINNGIIIEQKEPDFINLCILLNPNSSIFGQDSITCFDCFLHYPCKGIEFNLSDIYNIKIEGKQNLNSKLYEPIFITFFIKNSIDEKDEIKIYAPELIQLLSAVKRSEWINIIHNSLNTIE